MSSHRLNLAIDTQLFETLKQIATSKNISVTKLINDRLDQSLTLEERLGKKPEWLEKMEAAGVAEWVDFVKLPESLQWYQDEINHLDETIEKHLRRKELVQAAFNAEVKKL